MNNHQSRRRIWVPASILSLGLILALYPARTAAAPRNDPPNVNMLGTYGGWSLGIDLTLDRGCFIITEFVDDTVVRFGLSPKEDIGYMIVGNPAWKSLEAGKKYPIEVQMGTETPWNADATGIDLDGMVFLRLNFEDPRFMTEFSAATNLVIRYKSARIANVTLDGTVAAINALANCQRTENNKKKGGDPFAPGGKPAVRPNPPVKDPFEI